MNLQEAKEKIQKCLALSDSPNEHEAQTALLMARKLMASYKLSDADLTKTPSSLEVEKRLTSITYSRRRDAWIGALANLIAEKHCCSSCYTHEYNKQTRFVEMIGFPDDLDLCIRAFEYAVYAVHTNIIYRKPAHEMSYALGFINGLIKAYDHQDECEETALVAIIPKEVTEYVKSTVKFLKEEPNERTRAYCATSYSLGVLDGKNHLTKKICKAEEGSA